MIFLNYINYFTHPILQSLTIIIFNFNCVATHCNFIIIVIFVIVSYHTNLLSFHLFYLLLLFNLHFKYKI